MKKILIIGLAVAAAIGFYRLSPKDQKQVSETGSAAVGAVGKVMGSAWSAIRDQAKGLNSDSDVVVLEKTRADLVKVRDDLEKKDAKGNKSAIEQLNLQIEKLDSAIAVKNLKKSMDDKVEAASKLKENSEKSVDDVKKKLADADAAYKDMQKKLDTAQATYDKAAKMAGL